MGSAMELLNSGTTHRVKQADIEGKRLVQGAYNEKEQSSVALARFSQSLGNERKLRAAGESINAQEQNIQHALDQSVNGTFGQRLAAAEELGNAAVNAAAAGVGGGSVDAYRQSLSIAQAINEQTQSSATQSDVINAKKVQGDTIKNAVASLDNDSFYGNFDYSTILDHVKQKNVLGAAILAGVATYYGGPQAGMAVTDAVASGNRFANNDQQGGQAYLNSALSKGFTAYQQYRDTGGNPWGTPSSAPTSAPAAQTGFFSRVQSAFNIK